MSRIERAGSLGEAVKRAARVAVPGSALALLLWRLAQSASAGGVVRLGAGGEQTVADWWLGGGTIASGNVLEYVESPAIGQLYAGAAVAAGQPWSIAIQTSWDGANNEFAFDSNDGRIVFGIDAGGNESVYNDAAWVRPSLINDATNRVFFIVTDGANGTLYRENVAVGAAFACAMGIDTAGNTRWRSYKDNPAAQQWTRAVPRAAVYDIAFSVAQRGGLYASMSS